MKTTARTPVAKDLKKRVSAAIARTPAATAGGFVSAPSTVLKQEDSPCKW
jgi:hypothetical protein